MSDLTDMGTDADRVNIIIRADFAIRKNLDGTPTIGKSVIYQPKIQHYGKEIKWYDDNKLKKKQQ